MNDTTTQTRAGTVLCWGEGEAVRAVTSAVVVSARIWASGPRLQYVGPVVFDDSASAHFDTVLVPIVDRVLTALGLAPHAFEISVANVGAAATMDTGVKVTGFSADVAVLVAMLFACLRIEVPADVAFTGHVASSDGDIRQVRDLPAKVRAVIAAGCFQKLVHPRADDDSLATLAPTAATEVHQALLAARREIGTIGVRDLAEALDALITDETAVTASLRTGFFGRSGDANSASGQAVARIVSHLAANSTDRFLSVLKAQLLSGRQAAARELLAAWAQHHCERGTYPTGSGRALLGAASSVPRAVRRLTIAAPLLDPVVYLTLTRLAQAADIGDLQLLYRATVTPTAADLVAGAAAQPGPDGTPEENRTAADLLAVVLIEISAETFTAQIGTHLDSARASFTMAQPTTGTRAELLDTISAFYAHLLPFRWPQTTPPLPEAVGPEALALLCRAFPGEDGLAEAFAEATDGGRGGLRWVLDRFVDVLKRDEYEKHVARVLAEAVDPLDWAGRVQLASAFLARCGSELPDDLRGEPPERYARRLKDLLRAWCRSGEQIRTIMRAL
jgi:hypothetical protein